MLTWCSAVEVGITCAWNNIFLKKKKTTVGTVDVALSFKVKSIYDMLLS